jgi:hypothetical protein
VGRAWLGEHDPAACALLDDLYSGRIPIADRVWKLLPLVAPEKAISLRSGESQKTTSLIARNLRPAKCQIFWLDFSGRRVSYGEMEPFGIWSGRTFATHAWLFTDEAGRPLAGVVTDPEPGRVDLR